MVALNALMSSVRDWTQLFSGGPGLGFSPHTIHRPKHPAMGQSLICRPLYDFREEEVAFAGGRLNALTLC